MVVIGAGPFGLSVAATLVRRGVPARVFGAPMQTWKTSMPSGLELRSAWDETSLWSGGQDGTISAWADAVGAEREEPLRLETFLVYADWFRRRFVADHVDDSVVGVERARSGFHVTTSAGAALETRHVVVAVGALPFVHIPDAFAEHVGDGVVPATDLLMTPIEPGQRVVVVGAGQAAVEAAKTAAGRGAGVELLARGPLHWFADREPWDPRGRWSATLYRHAYPALGYGPPPLNRIVLNPDLFAILPRRAREVVARRVLRAGAPEADRQVLRQTASLAEGVAVERVVREAGGLRLRLSDGSERLVSLVVLATGYRFALERLPWLAPDLRRAIRTIGPWPQLDRAFGSSVVGLRFVGYAAEGRYGPLSRFVLGAQFTAERVAEVITRAATAARAPDR